MLGQDNFWRKMRQQVNLLWLIIELSAFKTIAYLFFISSLSFFYFAVYFIYLTLCTSLQIYKENKPFYYINTYDETKSNWMRYVSAPYSPQSQNLIACQCGVSIQILLYNSNSLCLIEQHRIITTTNGKITIFKQFYSTPFTD